MPPRGLTNKRPKWHDVCQFLYMNGWQNQTELAEILHVSRKSVQLALSSDQLYMRHKARSSRYQMAKYQPKRRPKNEPHNRRTA